jgi:glycosyltransferase involved in cell wall biosynthesis
VKVAFFLGALNRGGAETLLADIFSRRVTLPFDAICVYRKEGTMSDSFHCTGVPMLQLNCGKNWFRYLIRFRHLVLRQKVDIVNAQTAFNAALAIISLIFTRVKVVTTLHGFTFVTANPLYKRLVFRNSSRIICVSQSECDEYLRRGSFGVADRFVVVHNGIDFSKFGHTQPPTDNGEEIKMCMVGSFGEGRNHLFVCHFLDALKKQGVQYHFTFIGAARESEKEIYDSCINYCHEHGLDDAVTFYGLSNDVPGLLAGMDAFVYATRHDSFGIAVIEAIATGLPTFVNDTDVMRELSGDGKLATLYTTNDVDALVSKIQHFVSHRMEYWQRAQSSASHVREQYSIERNIANLSIVYQGLYK